MHDVWRIDGQRASCDWLGLQAQIDLTKPHEGLMPQSIFDIAMSQTPAAFRVLGVQATAAPDSPLSIEDCYARDGDLIVTYASGPASERRYQIYWRIDAGEISGVDVISIDLQASVQTPRLDIDVELWTRSMLLADNVDRFRSGEEHALAAPVAETDDDPTALCWVASRGDSPIRYAEMVHPSDYRQSRCSKDAEHFCVEHRLFADKLEKGVILRSRLRALFLNTPNWQHRVDVAWRQFVHSPLPLTA